jgi:CHRD domain
MRKNQICALTVGVILACAAGLANAGDVKVKLTGEQEVPAVKSSAVGTGTITVGADGSVSGKVMTKDIQGTMAHIHAGAVGQNGPPIIALTKTADDTWSVPAGSKFTDDQLKSFKAGDLYVNVHSDANKGGEIRAQLKP